MIDPALGEFVDQLTLRFVRCYPVAPAVVWKALVQDASQWFAVRPVLIDPVVGGAGVFGPAEAPVWSATVLECDEATTLAFDHPDVPEGGALRFDLRDDGGDCGLVFTQQFRPGGVFVEGERFGTDFPAGTELPWRPGFVAGFHLMFDNLRYHLGGPAVRDAEREWHDVLVPAYREHIRVSLGSSI